MTPIICGTVVNKGLGQPQFDRKLKMLRAPLFAMMMCLQAKDFVVDNENAEAIQKAMQEFLRQENYHLLDSLDITEKLDGWDKLLKYMCLENELMDVKNINPPDFDLDLYEKDYYVYAGYLKPGYHQILIFDPKLEKAFCKDFVVNLNLREDIFPEYPSKD